MTIYIAKPGTWYIPFSPVQLIEQYIDPKKAFFGTALFSGWIWKNMRPQRDEEVCLLYEFWVIKLW